MSTRQAKPRLMDPLTIYLPDFRPRTPDQSPCGSMTAPAGACIRTCVLSISAADLCTLLFKSGISDRTTGDTAMTAQRPCRVDCTHRPVVGRLRNRERYQIQFNGLYCNNPGSTGCRAGIVVHPAGPGHGRHRLSVDGRRRCYAFQRHRTT